MSRRVLLYDIEKIMLIIEDPAGVRYQNQVGGVVCWQAELEGILCPLDIDAENASCIENLPYTSGAQGISAEVADRIDAILASRPSTSFLRVDRARLDESWEAWVYVLVGATTGAVSPDMPVTDMPLDTDMMPIRGFDTVRGVLTWPNSD